MGKLGRLLTAGICLLAPRRLKPPLLRLLGHQVANGARIGPSLVFVHRLHMDAGASIGALNVIKIRRVVMRKGAQIQNMNVLKGPLSVRLAENAAIGNRNTILRGPMPGRNRPSRLSLGVWSKVTAAHYIELGESINFGNYATLAGCGSQLWTHGFVHMSSGLDRATVRGRIKIGNNVYIGSHSTLGAGITIGDAVAIGAHSSVAKSLMEAGVYVSPPLRFIPSPPEKRLASLTRVEEPETTYYWKDGGGEIPAAGLFVPAGHV